MYRSVFAVVVVVASGGCVGGGVGAGSLATSAARGPSLVTEAKNYFCILCFFSIPKLVRLNIANNFRLYNKDCLCNYSRIIETQITFSSLSWSTELERDDENSNKSAVCVYLPRRNPLTMRASPSSPWGSSEARVSRYSLWILRNAHKFHCKLGSTPIKYCTFLSRLHNNINNVFCQRNAASLMCTLNVLT